MSAPQGLLRALSLLAVTAFGARLISRHRAARRPLAGNVAVITGGSRGLGLAIARVLAEHGCELSICARDRDSLEVARADLESRGASVAASTCDVSDRHQVQRFIAETIQHFGRIDILINNAGEITVGPIEHQTLRDFERAMDVMFWGGVYATLEVLPTMRARGTGHIVNITSIGGKVSVPHLLPYSAAKFAAIGFSEGAHAELGNQGIHVLTVVPGLMRTGSHLNALFKGQHRKEFTWFSLGATLPVTSMSAEHAARRIVRAIQTRDTELILTWQANALARLHGLMPGLTSDTLSLVNRLLPGTGGIGPEQESGYASQTRLTESPIETLGTAAGRRLNQ